MHKNNPRFEVGKAVRALRTEKRLSLDDAAGDAGMNCTDRFWRLEMRSANLDRWLADLDRAARLFGLTVAQLLERARVQ